jgi:Uncharacterized conserved protein (DUF2285)
LPTSGVREEHRWRAGALIEAAIPTLPEQLPGGQIWANADHYSVLLTADRNVFAWEWLRRSSAYQEAWWSFLNAGPDSAPGPGHFGLERYEDPERAAPRARPVWSASLDPTVIRATIDDIFADRADVINLRQLAPFVSLAVGQDDVEHLLFSDGCRFIRIDLAEGSLIGCPSSLRYKLRGIAGIRRPLPALQRLVCLIERGRIPRDRDSVSNRRERWILELRVADALASGATQQEIAGVLFGPVVTPRRWRAECSAYRQRVQRLARGARARLRQPLDRRWF